MIRNTLLSLNHLVSARLRVSELIQPHPESLAPAERLRRVTLTQLKPPRRSILPGLAAAIAELLRLPRRLRWRLRRRSPRRRPIRCIEPEWVDQAESVIAKTAGDPHAEEEAVEALQLISGQALRHNVAKSATSETSVSVLSRPVHAN